MDSVVTQQSTIHKDHVAKAKLQRETRVIESSDRRIVHFVFDSGIQSRESPYARKLRLMLSGELEEFEKEEHEAVENYLEKLIEEQLEDTERWPVIMSPSHNVELELRQIESLSFGVADNPFFKLEPEKYYPEAIILSDDGEILAHINNTQTQCAAFPSLHYKQKFRDDRMRINDDRKITWNFADFKDRQSVHIILLVRSFDLR